MTVGKSELRYNAFIMIIILILLYLKVYNGGGVIGDIYPQLI